MAVSASPSIPTESSTAAPGGKFSDWFKNIGDWIKSLSPNGATQYDTDWVTSGLTITPGTDWTVGNYRVRRVGKEVYAVVEATYSGATVTAGADGNMTDLIVATLPSGWYPVAARWRMLTGRFGITEWFGSIDQTGRISLNNGMPGIQLIAGHVITFYGQYLVD